MIAAFGFTLCGMPRTLIGFAIALATIVLVSTAHADKSRVLVLPLPASASVDADVARAFDARLLVALDDQRFEVRFRASRFIVVRYARASQ